MSENVTSVVLAGVGGQGILLASDIVAHAAMQAGFDVKTNEVHGMAQRGGSVVAQVRFGAAVCSPLVPERTARILCALEKAEAVRFAHYLAPDGLAVVSNQEVVPVTVATGESVYPADLGERLPRLFSRLIYVDAVELARGLGDIRTANTLLLGAVSTGLDLPVDAWMAALKECVREKHLPLNREAFNLGRTLA